MKISDLNPAYDKLQQEYGAKELTSIWVVSETQNKKSSHPSQGWWKNA